MKISPLATAPNFKLRPLTIALTSVLLASDPASAEEPAMEPIIVKAVRPSTPFLSSTAVDAADIASQRAATSDTASLLKNVPGVSLYGAGGVSSLPSIHGLADDRLRIKVDGADLVASCPNHMNSDRKSVV